jgi:hypothetical protein
MSFDLTVCLGMSGMFVDSETVTNNLACKKVEPHHQYVCDLPGP